MKKNYEKDQLVITTSFIFIIVFLIFIFKLFNIRYRTYNLIDSIVINDNYLELIINSKNYKLLKSSKFVYIDDKKIKIEITSIERNVIKKNREKFHEVIIRLKVPKKYKDNDVVTLTIFDKKTEIINIFKSCWKEEE